MIPLTASAQLPLQSGDTICIIGNGLADRMQHDGCHARSQSGLSERLASYALAPTIHLLERSYFD